MAENTSIQSTRLDFDNIKSRLKSFLAAKNEFTDYNFEASGLSNLLDVLSYNTHFNGLIANFALNESFLKTAQLRSSVVSLAESLGYSPRSRTASAAYVTLSVNLAGVANRPSSIVLPRYTSFSTNLSSIQFTFQTDEVYVANDNGVGLYVFRDANGSSSIPIYEGQQKTKTFFVGELAERQVYVIPDANIDTARMDVRVYDNPTTSQYSSYTPLYTAVGVTAESRYYSINEAPNEYYEVIFGDGVSTGLAPVSGNKIVIDYIASNGESANGAAVFNPVSTLTVDGSNYTVNVETVATSSGGTVKESIESIRQNAPLAFASQQRLVTADDYRAVILSNYSTISDVVAWGGQDNDPPQYGKTYVGLKFEDNVSTAAQTTIKNSITNDITSKLSMLSIDTVYVDPITTFLELEVLFNFDPDLTGITSSTAEQLVLAEIQNYFDDSLKKFDKTFRKSVLMSRIQNLTPAILNARTDIKLNQSFTPVTNGLEQSAVINFPVRLEAPNGGRRVITSSNFTFNNSVCQIVNQLIPHSTKLQVVDLNGKVLIDNIGEYDNNTGKVLITGLIVDSIQGGNINIDLKAIPANSETIRPLRNYILNWNVPNSFAAAQIDRQTNLVTLS